MKDFPKQIEAGLSQVWKNQGELEAALAAAQERVRVLVAALSTIDSRAQFDSSAHGPWYSKIARTALNTN